MGCKCGNPNIDENTEMKPEIISANKSTSNNNNNNDELIKEEGHMKKYSDYPEKMINLINKIRQNPREYADVIEDSIQNITTEDNAIDPNKPKLIYKEKVKVALIKGEQAFREAAQELRNMRPIPPLEFKEEMCIPLPDNEKEFKDSNYLRSKVKELLSKNVRINVFFKEMVKLPHVSVLLMIVDDNGKNSGKKRRALLNENFKYIGITYRFIGKTFISYFSFSK
jgi:hypothetical protein